MSIPGKCYSTKGISLPKFYVFRTKGLLLPITRLYLSKAPYKCQNGTKEALYRLAINNTELTHITSNITRKVQSGAENTKKAEKVSESRNELQSVAVSNKEEDKGINNSNEMQSHTVSNNKEGIGARSSDEANKDNKLT